MSKPGDVNPDDSVVDEAELVVLSDIMKDLDKLPKRKD